MNEQSDDDEKGYSLRPFRKSINANIPIRQFKPYVNNPFRIYVDGPDHPLVQDIKQRGVTQRITARFTSGEMDESGEELYEIISGHNRLEASKLAGLDEIPAHIITLQDDKVDETVICDNIQRTGMTPSEYGRVFRLRLDVLSRQGKRTDLTSGEKQQKSSRDEVGIPFGISGSKVRQYIRFAYLTPEFQTALDNKEILKSTAENISYLRESEQQILHDLVLENKKGLTPEKAKLLKIARQKADEENQESDFTKEQIFTILNSNEEEKTPSKSRVPKNIKIPYESIKQHIETFFEGQDLNEEKIRDIIMKAVSEYKIR